VRPPTPHLHTSAHTSSHVSPTRPPEAPSTPSPPPPHQADKGGGAVLPGQVGRAAAQAVHGVGVVELGRGEVVRLRREEVPVLRHQPPHLGAPRATHTSPTA
jgi:hypothetical protein